MRVRWSRRPNSIPPWRRGPRRATSVSRGGPVPRARLDRGQLGRVIQGEGRRALRVRAPQVLNRAKILAPVDTGRLRASGKVVYSSTFGFRPKATIVFDVEIGRAHV